MCGIAGIFSPDREAAASGDLLRAMTQAVQHRGPDDSGFHIGPGIGLGFRRLSILDLVSGNQPMYCSDQRVVSVCNGEIFNHDELRLRLQALGHVFRTRTDTEVLPPLFREHGPAFAGKLNGQFAFAVYDATSHRLVLGRDPIGIAPLFYCRTGAGDVVFGSEIKALLAHPGVARQADLRGLDQVLTFPGPVSPQTLIRGVHSVPPGCVLVFEADGSVAQTCYWDLDYPLESEIDFGRSLADCVDELEAALLQAIRYRLQSDVPVGNYLSGGLDSSLIAAMTRALTPHERRHTFSITFDDPRIDESGPQQLMAKALQSLHHEHQMGPSDIEARLQEMVWHAETPLRESYNACTFELSRMARQAGIKVVLSGEGADELFGGYVGYRLDVLRRQDAQAPADDDLDAMLERQMRLHLWGDAQLHYEKPYHAFTRAKRALYAAQHATGMNAIDCLQASPVDPSRLRGRHPLHQRSYLDFKLRMADHLLADHGDRVAFANGVEARYPFLDLGVIEVARRIPPSLLIHEGEEKFVLKELARRYLPAAIVERRKFSFVAPSSASFLRDASPQVKALVGRDRLVRDGVFDPDVVAALTRRGESVGHEPHQTYDDDVLMVVLTFNLLVDLFELELPQPAAAQLAAAEVPAAPEEVSW